jgi:formate-dependent nitrite reductase membrane component NrfD
MTRGRDARLFWIGAVLVGMAVPFLLGTGAVVSSGIAMPAAAVAAVTALAGLLAYEDSWIRAGQAVPLS